MSIKEIVKFINTKTTQKDKRIYMSIIYLNKYIMKDTLFKDMSMIMIEHDNFTRYWLIITTKEGSYLNKITNSYI